MMSFYTNLQPIPFEKFVNALRRLVNLAGILASERPGWSVWLEAIAESHRNPKYRPRVTTDSIRQWFAEADLGQVSDRQEVPPRVRVDTRRSEKSVVFDTCDHAFNDAALHKNLVAN